MAAVKKALQVLWHRASLLRLRFVQVKWIVFLILIKSRVFKRCPEGTVLTGHKRLTGK
jgi:hypothetical protein